MPVSCRVHRISLVLIGLAGSACTLSAGELIVDANDPVGVLTPELQLGVTYQIDVVGEWYRDAIHPCDAEWYEPDPPGSVWRRDYHTDPELLDLQVNQTATTWFGRATADDAWSTATYSPDHHYRLWYTGTGEPINLRIYDDEYDQNTGSVIVTIVPEPRAVSILACALPFLRLRM